MCVGLACAGSERQPTSGRVKPHYSVETGRLEHMDYDQDGDGTLEGRAYLDGPRIQRIEIDLNGDGKPDRWEYYEPDAGTSGKALPKPAGQMAKVEEATRFDGKVSWWVYYEGGAVVCVDEDVDGDGRIDKWERYADGRLTSVELDLAGSGAADRRLDYLPDGTVRLTDLRPPRKP